VLKAQNNIKKKLPPPTLTVKPVFMNTTLLSKSEKNQKANRRLFLGFLSGLVFLTLSFQQAKAQNCSVNAGVDETICEDQPMVLIGNKTGAFPPGGGVVTWEQVGGPTVVIVNPNSLTTSVTNFTGGYTYIFRLKSTCQDGSLVFQDVK